MQVSAPQVGYADFREGSDIRVIRAPAKTFRIL